MCEHISALNTLGQQQNQARELTGHIDKQGTQQVKNSQRTPLSSAGATAAHSSCILSVCLSIHPDLLQHSASLFASSASLDHLNSVAWLNPEVGLGHKVALQLGYYFISPPVKTVSIAISFPLCPCKVSLKALNNAGSSFILL